MSEDQLSALLREFEGLLIQRLAPFIRWGWVIAVAIVGLIGSVVHGTARVVEFVQDVRTSVKSCEEVNKSQGESIAAFDREHRDLEKVVIRHEAILNARAP